MAQTQAEKRARARRKGLCITCTTRKARTRQIRGKRVRLATCRACNDSAKARVAKRRAKLRAEVD